MPKIQKSIYYLASKLLNAVKDSPFLETLKKKGFEVLLLVDPINKYTVMQLKEFDSHKLVCISKEGLELKETKEEETEQESDAVWFKDLCKVEKVVISNCVTNSPYVLITSQFGWSANMEHIMKAQVVCDLSMLCMALKKMLELNHHNLIVKVLNDKITKDKMDKLIRDLTYLLFEAVLLTSNFVPDEPTFICKAYWLHDLTCR